MNVQQPLLIDSATFVDDPVNVDMDDEDEPVNVVVKLYKQESMLVPVPLGTKKRKMHQMTEPIINKKQKIECKDYYCAARIYVDRFNKTGKRYCIHHKLDGMVRITNLCSSPDCTKFASCNYTGKKKRLYCAEHKLPNMVILSNKHNCEGECGENCSDKCRKRKLREYKAKKQKQNPLLPKRNTCITCGKTAAYNYKTEDDRLYCEKHKLPDMVKLTSAYCVEEDCFTFASFNFKGKVAKYCKKHRLPDMINVNAIYCKHTDCSKRATYRHLDDKTDSYCIKHKLEGMVNFHYEKKKLKK